MDPGAAVTPEGILSARIVAVVLVTVLAGAVNTVLLVAKGYSRHVLAWLFAWLPLVNHVALPVFIGLPDAAVRRRLLKVEAALAECMGRLDGRKAGGGKHAASSSHPMGM